MLDRFAMSQKTDVSRVWICAEEYIKNATGHIKQIKFLTVAK